MEEITEKIEENTEMIKALLFENEVLIALLLKMKEGNNENKISD